MGQSDPGDVSGKESLESCPVLIINLDRSPDRLSFQQAQAARIGLGFERVAATDGAKLSQADYERYAYRWQRPLSRTEVGCLLSHAACWERVVELKRNTIVLEDDIVLAREIVPFLEQAETVAGVAVINLETRARPRFVSPDPVSSVGEQRLHTLYTAVAGSAAYLVTPPAATRLLKRLPNKAAIADAYLWGRRGIRYLQIDPALGVPLDVLEDHFDRQPAEETATTIRRPNFTFGEKLTLLARHPVMRLRRARNQMQLGMTKLVLRSRALMRTVAPSPSIFANYEALKSIGHG